MDKALPDRGTVPRRMLARKLLDSGRLLTPTQVADPGFDVKSLSGVATVRRNRRCEAKREGQGSRCNKEP